MAIFHLIDTKYYIHWQKCPRFDIALLSALRTAKGQMLTPGSSMISPMSLAVGSMNTVLSNCG